MLKINLLPESHGKLNHDKVWISARAAWKAAKHSWDWSWDEVVKFYIRRFPSMVLAGKPSALIFLGVNALEVTRLFCGHFDATITIVASKYVFIAIEDREVLIEWLKFVARPEVRKAIAEGAKFSVKDWWDWMNDRPAVLDALDGVSVEDVKLLTDGVARSVEEV